MKKEILFWGWVSVLVYSTEKNRLSVTVKPVIFGFLCMIDLYLKSLSKGLPKETNILAEFFFVVKISAFGLADP